VIKKGGIQKESKLKEEPPVTVKEIEASDSPIPPEFGTNPVTILEGPVTCVIELQ
jgi:hypothetical protein